LLVMKRQTDIFLNNIKSNKDIIKLKWIEKDRVSY
jgi:hypothetical protein